MEHIHRLLRNLACVALLALLPISTANAQTQVAELFRTYYNQHDGIRVLGNPLTDLVETGGYAAQYFEKGRIEDHRSETSEPRWAFMFGRLTEELIAAAPTDSVNATSMTYGELNALADWNNKHAPPRNFQGGTVAMGKGIFIPYDPQLRPARGSIVPPYFWTYINRADLFPGGWLHDIGLPMTDAFNVSTVKAGQQRTITMQAFERAVLTYDAKNPAAWQIERGNVGTDLVRTFNVSTAIQVPAAFSQATLPLHVLARVGAPGDNVVVRLHWQDGTELMRIMPVLRGADGYGLVIGNINWMNEGQPPQPATQSATVEMLSASGELLERQPITMLSMNDPNTQPVTLYWVLGDTLQSVQQRVPRTPAIGTAALNELLWGPGPPNLAGFTTAIPLPEQVLSYGGREANWGARVTLRKLTIVDGVATADFSRELKAYGGGSLRVMLIRQQITRTLLQFPSVHSVRIAIEGQTEGVLEP